MTSARQIKLQRLKVLGMAAAILLTIAGTVKAAAPERLVVNPETGLVISGFDPVAYFTDGAAEIGKPEFELSLSGAVWRFRNEGNRAEFEKHPEVYGPRFGGYDPVAIARGVSVPGHPEVWVIVGERLYLFYSAQARSEFIAEPGRYIDAAERKWPSVAIKIAR